MDNKAITDWREALAFLLMHGITFTGLERNGYFKAFHGLERLIGTERDRAFQQRPMKTNTAGTPPPQGHVGYSREVLIQAAQALQGLYDDDYYVS